MKKAILLSLTGILTACGQDWHEASVAANSPNNLTLQSASPQTSSADDVTVSATAVNPAGFSICSKLDVTGINWSSAILPNEREVMALALNISGSFEGHTGWINLTNNFDGQGLSLGLLNQCLGQGSLQPLLISMRNQYPSAMKSQFSAANLSSLLGMLTQYESHVGTASDLNLSDFGLSKLDDPAEISALTGLDQDQVVQSEALSKTQESVQWAISTLYNGSKFKPDWNTQLSTMASSVGYRSIQVNAASSIHAKALKYMSRFKLSQVRSYLFFFDLIVQNGGIPEGDYPVIDAGQSKNPHWGEADKLNAILAQRLTHVKSIYRADVSSRKTSLIKGTGVVHGSNRNYSKEYCTQINVALP